MEFFLVAFKKQEKWKGVLRRLLSKNFSTLELKKLIRFAFKTTVLYSGNLTFIIKPNMMEESHENVTLRKDDIYGRKIEFRQMKKEERESLNRKERRITSPCQLWF